MRKTRILVGVLGAAALLFVIWRIGFRNVVSQLRSLSLILPVILAASAVRVLFQTKAWSIALRAEGIDIPQSRLIGIRLASLATGYLAALGPAVSEPAKLVLLRGSASLSEAAPATFVETGMYWFVTVLLGLAGTLAAALLISNSAVIYVSSAVFGSALIFLVTRRPFLSWFVKFAGKRAPKWLLKAESVEGSIRSFRDRHPQAAWKVFVFDAAGQVLTLVEVAAVLWSAGIRPTVSNVLVIEAAGRVVKVVAAWIPGRIGADEGGAAGIFVMLGFLPAAGLMLALARRVRDILWCAAGVVWLTKSGMDRRAEAGARSQPLCVEEH